MAVATLGGLSFVLASILVLAHRKLAVPEDPRIDVVEELLPHANCGACGFAGCRAFAEALVQGDAAPGRCTVSDASGLERIARFLRVEVGQVEKRVARLACAGGDHVARVHARYDGLRSCRAAAVVAGGGKSCAWGCLGYGDCADVCSFGAIEMDPHGLPVVDEALCTACGDCVEICPKDLFTLHPVSHRLWVACRSLEIGDAALATCEVACTACGRCAADAPEAVRIEEGLAVVRYDAADPPRRAIERCPTGAICWFDPEEGVVHGLEAKRIVRQSALPLAPT